MARSLQAQPGITPSALLWMLGMGALSGCRGCRDQGEVLLTSDLIELAGCEETTVYLDQDGDGYGDPTTATRSCAAPDSVVGNDLDCDDADPALTPDVEAVCADNLDNDCDGEPDCPGLERRTGLDEATAVLMDQYEAASGDGMAIADLTGDGVMDLLIGAPYAEEGDYRGLVRLVTGPVIGEIDLNSADVPDISSDQDYLEGAYVAAGDMGGDGYVDLIMGVASSSREEKGIYIVSGPVLSEYHLDSDDPIYLSLPFADGESGSFAKVQVADVYEGDGQLDLLLDGRLDNDGLGSAFFMPGPILEGGSVYDAAETALYQFWDDEAGGVNNVDLVGDVNGDGVDDVAAMFALETLYLIFELPAGTYDVPDVADTAIEIGRRDLGEQFLSPGDVDGDGLDDLLTTAANPIDVYWGSSPYVYLFSGTTLSAAGGRSLDADDDSTAIFDGGSYSQIGMGMASPGDLNEDGYSDIFIGDPQASGGDGDHYEGRAALWYSPVEGTVTPGQADILIQGDEIGSRTGWRVAASPRDAQNNAILLVGTWPLFGDSTLYQFTPDGY